MSALKRAWEREHGAGSVVGLAPSEAAAQALGNELGITVENTARWWKRHLHQNVTFDQGQLVILDEASLAGTASLNRITEIAATAGDRKSTRLNSSHVATSYAVFCLKKKR